ncbi:MULTISPECIES: YdcF family protein [Chromobacterium]|uniref:YdcF family protein n=1 Tax=Chromobacterium TaxID=535 RepID=UPI0018888C3F|nr:MULTISPECIES: YdcF family protein [Chromobacterium]QOZ81602.1 YdcF family protein [Chromobacterium sp. Rain0013]WON85856.1 YdcF family protein [Chromobacterium haemolyticum]
MWRRYPRLGAVLAWLGLCALLAGVVALPLLRYSKNWLPVEAPLAKADWIVVLGGESGQRVIGAAELYHRGVAPRIFVSGEGDCKLIVNRLVMAGVPAPRIAYECVSRNTFQNAEQTRVSLQAFQPKRALLVTSWYHSARALTTFRQVWPEVNWGMHFVYPGNDLYHTLAVNEAGAVLSEYVKTLVYSVRYWTFK